MLVDSNTLLRTLQPRSSQREIARAAIKTLKSRHQDLCITPQNLVEVWVVATRPAQYNGLGMNTEAAADELTRIKDFFKLLVETPALYPIWEALVVKHRVSGKPAYDARLVAAMQVHGEKSILTFNGPDFRRYPDIEVIDPATVSLL